MERDIDPGLPAKKKKRRRKRRFYIVYVGEDTVDIVTSRPSTTTSFFGKFETSSNISLAAVKRLLVVGKTLQGMNIADLA